MSHLFAIGVDPIECSNTPLLKKLLEKRFIRADIFSHEYAIEAHNFLKSSDTGLEWYIASDEVGCPDLDLTYQLPKEIDEGQLKSLLNIMINYKDITKLGILMYDLGTRRSKKYDDLNLDDIKTTLKNWYEFGGPDITVYHLFKR
ncbi:MAG: hypothetical protein KKD44_11095 [Proteobacteria bacterium]|nr:hypothetical protein [Pseudomonadota bacterium]